MGQETCGCTQWVIGRGRQISRCRQKSAVSGWQPAEHTPPAAIRDTQVLLLVCGQWPARGGNSLWSADCGSWAGDKSLQFMDEVVQTSCGCGPMHTSDLAYLLSDFCMRLFVYQQCSLSQYPNPLALAVAIPGALSSCMPRSI